jgi:hypothetical protein
MSYNTLKFYQKIIDMVVVKIGRPLSTHEEYETKNFIKNVDPKLLTPAYETKTMGIMVTTLVGEFKKFDCTKPRYDDSQQTIRNTIGISSEAGTSHSIYENKNISLTKSNPEQTTKPTKSTTVENLLGLSTAVEAVRLLNPDSLLRKVYLMLDSRYRVLDTTNSLNEFKWDYILQSGINTQGSVSVIGNVRDIVALRVYPFRIPYAESADNKYSRVSLFIKEFGAQSFVAHENRNFHFMLESEVDGSFINLITDKYNDGFFYLSKPVTTINNLTISFGSPVQPVIFDKDRDSCQIDYFSIAPLTKITIGYPNVNKHNLVNGDRVYFSNFNVGDISPLLPIQNQINQDVKKNINDSEGHLITVIDPYSFSIDYDSSIIQNPLPDIILNPTRTVFIFDVFYGSKRIFLPIELTYIMPESGQDIN